MAPNPVIARFWHDWMLWREMIGVSERYGLIQPLTEMAQKILFDYDDCAATNGRNAYGITGKAQPYAGSATDN